MMNRIILTLAASLFLAVQVHAGEVTVNTPWARATAPGQEVGLVGMEILSQKEARLIKASSEVSKTAEIHTMSMDNGVMQMRQLEDLPLPAKQTVTLGMGGNHLMLIDLKHALKAGDTVSLTLTVQFADKSIEKVKVKALVRPISSVSPMSSGHENHSHH